MKNNIKRIVSLSAALVMCTASMFSCKSEKKPETVQEPAVEEPVFIEGSVETANRINVPVTINRDAEPPLTVNKLEGIDFLEIMPEEIKAYGEKHNAEQYTYSISESCMINGKAYVNIYYRSYVTVYVEAEVDYSYTDNTNLGIAVFEIDLETGENEIIYMRLDNHDGSDGNNGLDGWGIFSANVNGTLDNMNAGNKYLYVDISHIENGDCYYETIALDPLTHEQKSVYKSEINPMWYSSRFSGNELVIQEHIYKYSEEHEGGMSTTYYDAYVSYYNEETGETSAPVLISEESNDSSLEATDIQDGKAVTVTYSDEENTIITSVEREGAYHVDMGEMYTSHSAFSLCTDTDILWTTSDSGFSGGKTYLYDYDVQTNTIYELDISSYAIYAGGIYPAGEGYIAMSSSLVYYLIPDMGMMFVLTPMGSYYSTFINGSIFSFCGAENASGFAENCDNFYWIDLTPQEDSEQPSESGETE